MCVRRGKIHAPLFQLRRDDADALDELHGLALRRRGICGGSHRRRRSLGRQRGEVSLGFGVPPLRGLDGFGLEITGRVPLYTEPNPENLQYLRTKRERMGHLLEGLD